MNKKGNIGAIIFFFVILFVVLFLGFIMLTGSAVLNWVFDEAVPELSNLGMVGDTNMTDVATYTISPVNNIVQSFTWLTGVLYVMFLIASVGMAFFFRMSPSKWLMGFYFMLVIILVMGSIFISNMYEDFSGGTDDLSTRLAEHTLLSFMILNSPVILTAVAFITGIVMFSGMQQEEYI